MYLRRPDVPFRSALRIAVVLPLIVPQFVLGYSWTQAYGRAGFTDTLIGVRWNGLTGPFGVAVVMIVDAVPLAYLLDRGRAWRHGRSPTSSAQRASAVRPAVDDTAHGHDSSAPAGACGGGRC